MTRGSTTPAEQGVRDCHQIPRSMRLAPPRDTLAQLRDLAALGAGLDRVRRIAFLPRRRARRGRGGVASTCGLSERPRQPVLSPRRWGARDDRGLRAGADDLRELRRVGAVPCPPPPRALRLLRRLNASAAPDASTATGRAGGQGAPSSGERMRAGPRARDVYRKGGAEAVRDG